MPRLTEAQHQERERGLGASDVAVAAGVSPWQTPFELYLEKIGELDREAQLDDLSRGRMERGHRFEDIALEWDKDANGGEPYQRIGVTVRHPRLPFLYCHPDARRTPWTKTRTLIEVKTSPSAWKEVPRHVEVQVMAQMAVTGATSCQVVVLSFDGAPQRFTVERDEELVAALEGLTAGFWSRVERRDPPPLDGSQGASRWLDRTRWRDEPELAANDSQAEALVRLLEVRAVAAQLQAEDDAIVNALKFSMMGSSRLVARGVGKVVWTAPTQRKTVSWKSVVEQVRPLVDEQSLAEAIDHHTTVKDDVRSFLVTAEGSTK